MQIGRLISLASVLVGAFVALLAQAQSQDSEMAARNKCVEFGFKDKTASHENCVKQFLQSSGVAKAPSKPAPVVAPAVSAMQREEKFWDGAMATGNREAFEAYLASYPKGIYAGLASANVARFNSAAIAQQLALAEAEQKLAAAEAEQKIAAAEAAQKLAAAEAEQKLAAARAALILAAAEDAQKAAAADAAKKLAAAEAALRAASPTETIKGWLASAVSIIVPAVREPGAGIRDCPDCPEMVVIPAGSFTMGSSNESANEKPAHAVNVSSFLIGKTEVTQGQWRSIMGNNPSGFTQCGDDCPVEQVTWNDAKEFVRRLIQKTGKQYRLPSEAEWEYAARAGSNTKWSFGDAEDSLGDYAWYNANSQSKTQRVAQKKPNALGLYDMHGNVWEWVEDCCHSNYVGAPTNGSAWTAGCSLRPQGQVLTHRGGSWYSDTAHLRTTYRAGYSASFRSDNLGLRLARTL